MPRVLNFRIDSVSAVPDDAQTPIGLSRAPRATAAIVTITPEDLRAVEEARRIREMSDDEIEAELAEIECPRNPRNVHNPQGNRMTGQSSEPPPSSAAPPAATASRGLLPRP